MRLTLLTITFICTHILFPATVANAGDNHSTSSTHTTANQETTTSQTSHRSHNANEIFTALTVDSGFDARRINLDIQFELNSHHMSPKAKVQLDQLGAALKRVPQDTIEIAGHTDSLGTTEYNLELSRKRAESVVSYLVENFELNHQNIVATGYGERFPRSGRAAGDPLNRRVEIINHGRWTSAQEVAEQAKRKISAEKSKATVKDYF